MSVSISEKTRPRENGISRTRPPLSALDLATVSAGGTSASAIAGTVEHARAADRLGLERFWVAEHHNMPMVASTSPATLLAHIGAKTTRIRLGSGGVMLPNHAPLVVAEQFAMLEAMYPGRIDLGLGRAPGTDQLTAGALRGGDPVAAVERFPTDVLALLAMLGDERPEAPPESARLAATPAAETYPQVWMLGSSSYGAQLAGYLGLPYVFANHFQMGGDPAPVARAYRAAFQPSAQLEKPHLMVSAAVIAAESEERAEFLAGPSRVAALSLRTGRLAPVVAPERVPELELSPQLRPLFDSLPGTQHVGTGEQVVAALDELVESTDADEILLTSTTFDSAAKIDTLERITDLWPR